MGVPICHPTSKTSVLAIERLKKYGISNATEHEKHKKVRTPPSMGVPICHPISKTRILAVEELKK